MGFPLYVRTHINQILCWAEMSDIPIEGARVREYSLWYEMAPKGIKTYNPAFDVTDAKYITAIITEKGIIYPPFEENLKELKDRLK